MFGTFFINDKLIRNGSNIAPKIFDIGLKQIGKFLIKFIRKWQCKNGDKIQTFIEDIFKCKFFYKIDH